MLSEIDEHKGAVKTYWSEVRERVAKIEPTFAALVDQLCPDKRFPLYLAYYPYGATIADTKTFFLPKAGGGSYQISDANTPKDVVKYLQYGQHDSPLGLVLEREFEQYIDLKAEGITIPWAIYKPGNFYSFRRNLSRKDTRVYAPNGILDCVAGGRSVFALPSIGCATQHSNLQRTFNIKSSDFLTASTKISSLLPTILSSNFGFKLNS